MMGSFSLRGPGLRPTHQGKIPSFSATRGTRSISLSDRPALTSWSSTALWRPICCSSSTTCRSATSVDPNTFHLSSLPWPAVDSCGVVVTQRDAPGDREHSRGKSQYNGGRRGAVGANSGDGESASSRSWCRSISRREIAPQCRVAGGLPDHASPSTRGRTEMATRPEPFSGRRIIGAQIEDM